jgi:dTDP-4-amino-4,6-dideoxygalactose transaminase|tara:strand:+ start:58 stop:783 length:726 start_codon:yes stop_codon:yes gene_type:complete
MDDVKYLPWPYGKLGSKERSELTELKEAGYDFSDPIDIIDIFEKKVAKFAGSKYAIAVNSASSGIFLCLKHYQNTYGNQKDFPTTITVPSRTYISVPMTVINAGFKVKFEDIKWKGIYDLEPFNLVDGATRWTKNMYVGDGALQVVSFQIKKRVPIGAGGMILTDNKKEYEWLKLASHDGRNMNVHYGDDEFAVIGWHMNMIPEDAARGILLMDSLPEVNEDVYGWENYYDISKRKVFECN